MTKLLQCSSVWMTPSVSPFDLQWCECIQTQVTMSPFSNPVLPSPASGPCFLWSACYCFGEPVWVTNVSLRLEGEGDWVWMCLALSESLSCIPPPQVLHGRGDIMSTTLCPEVVTELGAEVSGVSSLVTSPASHHSLQIYFRFAASHQGCQRSGFVF